MQGSVLMRKGHPLGLQGSQGTVFCGSVNIMVSCLPKKAHLYQNFRITRVTTRLLSTIKDTEGTSQVLKRVPPDFFEVGMLKSGCKSTFWHIYKCNETGLSSLDACLILCSLICKFNGFSSQCNSSA